MPALNITAIRDQFPSLHNLDNGNYYALETMSRLGLESAVRVGLAHYNTLAEIDRLLEVVDGLAKTRHGQAPASVRQTA